MAQRIHERNPRRTGRTIIVTTMFLLLVIAQIGMIDAKSSTRDFENALRPLETVYDLTKYAATLISGLVMLFAGITYITSGSDPGKRDKAKNMVMYVIIGLMVIWAAPFVVDIILGG
jgi:hypothetical protein